MAPRRRHLCFFRRANPTFAGAPGPPAARCLSESLPGSLGFPAGDPGAPAAVPRARHGPQTAPRSAQAPAHFAFAGGWLCGAREPPDLRPPVGKLTPGTTRAPTPDPLRGPPTWRNGAEAAPTNTRRPELGDSQPGRVGTRGEGSSPRGPVTSWGSPGHRPPGTPNPSLSPGPSRKLSLEELEGLFQTLSLPPLESPLPSTRPQIAAWRFLPEPEPPKLPGTPGRRGLASWVPYFLQGHPHILHISEPKSSFTCLLSLGVLGVRSRTTRSTRGGGAASPTGLLKFRVCQMGCGTHHWRCPIGADQRLSSGALG
ncbi:hypothetical protein NN561_002371 [Cricetulus griseus]